MTRRRAAAATNRPTFTVQVLKLVATGILILHAVAGLIVGLATIVTVLAAVGASSQLEQNADRAASAAAGTMMPILIALIPIAAIVLSAVPWGMILLLCQIANDVGQLKGSAHRATSSAAGRHSEAQETLEEILCQTAATAERLERATKRKASQTNGNPAEPPRRRSY